MPNDVTTARVVEAFDRFQAALSRQHVPHFLELTLTLAQVKTLYLVAAAGPLRMSEVADRLGTAPSTASGVVEGLVQRGLVERVEDPTDRRQVLVRATGAAHEQLELVHDLGRGQLRAMLHHIGSEADMATIEHAINLLTAAAVAAEDPD